jgi:hypothetical protein
MKNCPFYGRTLFTTPMAQYRLPFLLLDTKGNRCALIIDRHAPCRMETDAEELEWKDCPLVREIRIELAV